MHPTRQRILEEIRVRPGLHKSLLRNEVGVAWGTILHHVRVLEEEGDIVAVPGGGRTRLFLPGDAEAREQRLVWLSELRTEPRVEDKVKARPKVRAALRVEARGAGQSTRALILEAIEERPGINKSELRRRLGMAWGSIWYHLDVLERSLCIRVHRSGTDVHLFPLKIPRHEVDWLSVLRDATRRHIAEHLLLHPDTSARQLAKRYGIGVRHVRRQLARLREVALIEPDAARPTRAARAFLERLVTGTPQAA